MLLSVGDVWLVTVWTGRQQSSRRLVSFSGGTEAGVEEAADDSLGGGGGSSMTANVFVTLYWWAARGYSSSGRLALNQPLNKLPAEAFQSGCVDRFRVRSHAAALSSVLTQSCACLFSSVHLCAGESGRRGHAVQAARRARQRGRAAGLVLRQGAHRVASLPLATRCLLEYDDE